MRRVPSLVRALSLLLVALAVSATHPAGAQNIVGSSVTLLSDGRLLILGGQTTQGVQTDAAVVGPDGSTSVLQQGMHSGRAWHTATVLPDGMVLIVGGLGRNGRLVRDVELFDPATHSFEVITDSGVTPRAFHTASLMTDGRVLIVGGMSERAAAEASAEMWSARTRTSEGITAGLAIPRRAQLAVLLPDGRVWLHGGQDGAGAAISTDEVFEPGSAQFASLPQPPALPGTTQSPRIAGSLPADGEDDVPVNTTLVIRFSKPMAPASISAGDLQLVGPAGAALVRVVVAEGGRLAFISPTEDLFAGSTYTVTISQGIDAAGIPLPTSSLTFTTAAPTTDANEGTGTGPFGRYIGHHGHDQYDLTPPGRGAELDEWEWRGERRDGKPYSPWQSLPPLIAPPGVTALSGQVLRLNGQPLASVTLQVGTRTTRTDASGRFLLQGVAGDDQVLIMDGSTANRPGRTYGIFDYQVYLKEDRTTVLPFTIWMPLLDTEHATAIPVPTGSEVIATSPRIPGLEVRIPQNVVLQTTAGPLRWMSLTQIPVDRPPFPLPEGTTFFFTPQAHGAVVTTPNGERSAKGVRMIMPNVSRLPAGLRLDLWTYEIGQHGWYPYGQGTVARDERQIIPDPGVEFFIVKCAFNMAGPAYPPATGPVVAGGRTGDPVDPATGLFIYEKTDLVVQDVIPIVITRKYRQLDSWGRLFGRGMSLDYQMFLAGDAMAFTYADLVLGDGSRLRYNRISPGTGNVDAIMEHTATPTGFFKSRLSWDTSRGGWQILFQNGTIYRFVNSAPGPFLSEIQDRWGSLLTITRIADINGHANVRISRITSPNGRWVDFLYSGSDKIAQLKDSTGRTVTYAYSPTQNMTSVTDAGGGVTTYTYDASDRMATIQDARGIVYLTNEYDTASRITRQTQADGTTYQLAYTLDVNGKIVQTDVTNPRGYVRRLTFDAGGYVLTDTDAQGTAIAQTTTFTRDATTHQTQTMTDALGRQTTYAYDTQGNVTSLTRLAGTANAVTATFTYEPTFQQLATVTDPLNHTTSLGYDGSGNLTSMTDPLSHVTALTYNAAGQPVTMTTPAGTTTLAYTDSDLSTVTDATGRTMTRFTDVLGRPVSVTNGLGQRSRLQYDALNQLTQATDPRGGITQFAYDPNGNLLSVTDALSHATTYVYNTMDRVVSRTDALLRQETFGYDNNGNVISAIDRKNQTTGLTYDALDRLTQRAFQDGSTIAYTWDAGNRLTQVVDSVSGIITRTYDGLDRLLSETTPNGTVTYTYDAVGRRTSMTVSGQAAITYAYDNADRLTSITQGTDVVTFVYDDANRRTRLTLPNGVSTDYAYDAASRLTGLTYKLGLTTLGNITYAHDPAGQRRQLGGTWARTLIPSGVATATYDAANQQTTFGAQALTYDLNGNLTGDGTNTYTWGARNQLTAVAGPVPAMFVYDPMGRRQRKTINGTMTDFVYDGLNPVRQTSGATAVDLLTGLGIDEYVMRTTSGVTEHFMADGLGSVLSLTDGAGAVQASYSYEPFGTSSITGASPNELGYTSREQDGTGLYYYRARYYHPQLQRFISEDPIEFDAGDVNLYVYVGNDPIDSTDPLGLFGIEDLPTIPAPVVNAVAGFGDAFLIPIVARWALDIDDVVDRCSTAYRRGMVGGIVVGTVPFVLRGAAALGGTRVGHFLNHNRLARIGPGRWPAGRGLPPGKDVPRLVLGPEKAPLPNLRHWDLRSRIPYLPPLGGLLGGRKDQCG